MEWYGNRKLSGSGQHTSFGGAGKNGIDHVDAAGAGGIYGNGNNGCTGA